MVAEQRAVLGDYLFVRGGGKGADEFTEVRRVVRPDDYGADVRQPVGHLEGRLCTGAPAAVAEEDAGVDPRPDRRLGAAAERSVCGEQVRPGIGCVHGEGTPPRVRGAADRD